MELDYKKYGLGVEGKEPSSEDVTVRQSNPFPNTDQRFRPTIPAPAMDFTTFENDSVAEYPVDDVAQVIQEICSERDELWVLLDGHPTADFENETTVIRSYVIDPILERVLRESGAQEDPSEN